VLPACITDMQPSSRKAWALEARRDSEAGLVDMVSSSEKATQGYEQAAAACRAKVEKIAAECRRTNQKYRDSHFDIEADMTLAMQGGLPDSLVSLGEDHARLRPMSAKRVEDIFENPRFFIEGATPNDVRQGNDGDCWFMSALCTLSNKEELIQRVCVARDEVAGVYGFVFHRGELNVYSPDLPVKVGQHCRIALTLIKMANGSPKSLMTSYTSSRRTFTTLLPSVTSGLSYRIARALRKSIGRPCRRDPVPCTLRNALIPMRPGCRCSRRHMQRLMETTLRSKADLLGMYHFCVY
jgi:hypothetical protein